MPVAPSLILSAGMVGVGAPSSGRSGRGTSQPMCPVRLPCSLPAAVKRTRLCDEEFRSNWKALSSQDGAVGDSARGSDGVPQLPAATIKRSLSDHDRGIDDSSTLNGRQQSDGRQHKSMFLLPNNGGRISYPQQR